MPACDLAHHALDLVGSSRIHRRHPPRRQAPKTTEPGGREHVLRILKAHVDPVRIGLPELDERVRHRRAVAVEDSNPQPDAIAAGIGAHEASERRVVGQREVEERADGLRRGRDEAHFGQPRQRERLAHAGSIIHNTDHDPSPKHRGRSALRTPRRRRRRQHGERHRPEDGDRRLQRDARRPRRREGRARPRHHREDAERRRRAQASSPPRTRPRSARGSPARRASRILDDVDLVVEAVFEDLAIKKTVFAAPRRGLPPRRDPGHQHLVVRGYRARAAPPRRPERVVGLHYFYHPAKNRLVEVVSGRATDPAAYRRAWRLQEALGKTPIASSDSYGFIVNRFFLPWLDRSRAHARGGCRRHGDDRRGGEEGVRDRHGSVRADERHRCPDRVACRDDARAGVRRDVRSAGAAARAGGIRPAVGDCRDAGRGTVHDRRRSAGDCGVLRRGRARRRGRRHDRRHRHRRARGAALAPGPVRADEPLRHRAGARSRHRLRHALEPAASPPRSNARPAPGSRSASPSFVRRSTTASRR